MTAIATKHTGRSSSYQFSVPNTDVGRQALEDYRKIAKVHNAQERIKKLNDPTHKPLIWQVAVNGRLGKDNPNALKYQARQKGSWRNAYQRIERNDAATLDIYAQIVKRVTTTYGDSQFTSFRFVTLPPAAILA